MKREMLPVVDARPPNYDAILAVLPLASADGVMFAYGDKVFYPGGRGPLPRELDAHERVHIERQGGDPESWWKNYLEDSLFRYSEELAAHRAEYQTYCLRHANPIKRLRALRLIARRLASPLYEGLIGPEQAQRDILASGVGVV